MRIAFRFWAMAFVCAAFVSTPWSHGQTCSAIDVGNVVVDPPTFLSLGFSLPINSGDADYDATVTVEYGPAGSGTWNAALPLMRVRPETVAEKSVDEQFAGSIMNLQPGTAYDVRFHLTDPDGCDETIQLTTSTRPEPPLNPATPTYSTVNSIDELRSAANAASPGDVIILANGVHVATHANDVAVRIDNVSGTFDNPIVIRGETRGSAVIDANGKDEGILTYQSNYIHIEDLVIRNAEVGIRLTGDTTGSVVRGNTLRNVTKGIYARHYIKRDITICDNDLQGGVVFPDIDNSTWNFEGIVVNGEGHVICYNTIAGFGDSLGFFESNQGHPIKGNDIYGNSVLWGGDDCVEFDYGDRNNRVFHNRCMNTATGISAQPVFGGPVYAYKNIIWNIQRTKQIKIANKPSGILFYNNLFGLRSSNSQSKAYNMDMRNNMFVGLPDQHTVIWSNFDVYGPSESEPPIIDYNGYSYDARFEYGGNLGGTHDNLAELRAETTLETHGRILSSPIFIDAIPTHANSSGIFTAPIEPALHPTSNAVDAGIALPTITDGYSGSAPDLGPRELGEPVRHYGIRWDQGPPDDTAPSVPQGLSATGQTQSVIQLTWSASNDPESGVSSYRVYRDGAYHALTTATNYSDTGLATSTTHAYEVTAVNGAGLESARSSQASGTTLADVTPPTIVSAAATTSPTEVIVVFSEPLAQASATTASNYSLSNGAVVQSAGLASDLVTVTLTTSTLQGGQSYTLTVNNVTDLALSPNPIAPGSTASFTYVNVTVVQVRIAEGADDVEESDTGDVDGSSGDLEMADNGGDNQTVGLRFASVSIPNGVAINRAYIQFRTDEVTVGAANLLVEGHAADDAAAFGTSVSTLPKTTTSIPWVPAPWDTIGDEGPDQRTPDLRAVIQEIVSRPGWQSGNAMAFIVTGSGTRTADSYNGGANSAPLLYVEYGTDVATEAPSPPTGIQVD